MALKCQINHGPMNLSIVARIVAQANADDMASATVNRTIRREMVAKGVTEAGTHVSILNAA